MQKKRKNGERRSQESRPSTLGPGMAFLPGVTEVGESFIRRENRSQTFRFAIYINNKPGERHFRRNGHEETRKRFRLHVYILGTMDLPFALNKCFMSDSEALYGRSMCTLKSATVAQF